MSLLKLPVFADVELNNNFTFASFLDPRYKYKFFTNKNQIIIASFFTLLKSETQSKNVLETFNDPESLSSDDEPLCSLQKKTKLCLFIWDVLSRVASTSSKNKQPVKVVEAEFKNYMELQPIKRKDCPYAWWKNNKEHFPILSAYIFKYLAVPGSTIFSEILFS